jgi:hypothetical protein
MTGLEDNVGFLTTGSGVKQLRLSSRGWFVPQLRLTQLLLLNWVIALVLVASSFETSRAQEVFQYKQTRPVLGMPEVRGVLPAGSTNYMPAVYQEDAGGWVIVADSFAAYHAARQAAITNKRPFLVEASQAETPDAPLAAAESIGLPISPSSPSGTAHWTTGIPVAISKPATPRCPLPPCCVHPGEDSVIHIRCGDCARAEAAALRLRARGLPITQANMNQELGYASTPPGPQCGRSQNSQGPARAPASSSVTQPQGRPGANQVRPTAATPATVAQPAPVTAHNGGSIVVIPPRPIQPPVATYLQPSSNRRLSSPRTLGQ